MFPWQEFFELMLQQMAYVFFDPLFWLVVAVVAFQYRRQQQTQLTMFGVYRYSLLQQILPAAGFGILGGLIASFLLNMLGVSITQIAFGYIWPLAIMLMLINLRFMCFAYAGGIVAVANVLFGWPEVNVPQVLALVAILHVTESILIYTSGGYCAVPMIIRHRDGRLVGAFSLQNFWPLPLVLLAAVAMPENALPAAVINTPDWWPLLPIAEQLPAGHTWVYGMLPAVAALGYGDVAISSTPAARRRRSAFHLACYSIVLLVLAVWSVEYVWLQFIAALVSPLGHELLIQLDNRREMAGQPRFVPPDRGVMVLDTVGNSPARTAGFEPGDILLDLAGMNVDSGFTLARAIAEAPTEFTVGFSREGRLLERLARFADSERRLGVILVPQGNERNYAQLATGRFGLIDWIRRRFGR